MNGEYQDVVCVSCGVERRRFIPGTLRDEWRERAMSWPFECEPCSEQQEHSAAEEAARRARLAEHRDAQYRLRISGLPERLRAASLSQLNGDQPSEDARRWAERQLTGLLLSGPVGAGKTYTAAAATTAALRHRQVLWCSVPSLLAVLGSDRQDPRHRQAIDALTGETALVLDDLDKARPTDYGAEQIFAAIDSRVSSGRPLLVTTNLELGEIATRYPQPYGEGIASRLAGHCVWHRLQRSDRRMAA